MEYYKDYPYGITRLVAQCPFNLSAAVMFHKHYDLQNDLDLRSEDYAGWADVLVAIAKETNPVFILPVYMYDHSGLDFSTGIEPYWYHAAWDSGRVGWLYVTRESLVNTWNKLFNEKRKNVTKTMRTWAMQKAREELKNYSWWINGYGAVLVEVYDKDEETILFTQLLEYQKVIEAEEVAQKFIDSL